MALIATQRTILNDFRGAAKSSKHMPPYNLLIVDDHDWQLEYLTSLFQSSGEFRVEAIKNGDEALTLTRSVQFDLLLLDMMMPSLDGVQFIRKLAQQRSTPNLALMSSFSGRILNSASLMAELLGMRVLARLSKPVTQSDVGRLTTRIEAARPPRYRRERELPKLDSDTVSDALTSGRMQAWFQPKVNLVTGEVVGAEALARLLTADGSVLLPGQFLPAITMFGLDEALLACVLKQTIEAQRMWSEHALQATVSINLPPHLLDDESLPDKILAWTRESGGAPGCISFEFTEESCARSQGNFFAGACRLRMMGFGLAQDDFSQGYSSLYNLVSTPYTELKIDRALVAQCMSDEGARAAVESAVTLGKRLGVTVVAEGVEFLEQFNYLHGIGCDAAQGFFVAGALNAHMFARFARNTSDRDRFLRLLHKS